GVSWIRCSRKSRRVSWISTPEGAPMSLRLESAWADESHSVADVGGDRLSQARHVTRVDARNRHAVLVNQVGGAEPAIHHAHVRSELQPQGLDELQQSLARLRAIDQEVKVEVALHVGSHVTGPHGYAHRLVRFAKLLQEGGRDVWKGGFRGFRL